MNPILQKLKDTYAEITAESRAQEELTERMRREQHELPIDQMHVGIQEEEVFQREKLKAGVGQGDLTIPKFGYVTNLPGGINQATIFNAPEYGLRTIGISTTKEKPIIENREMLKSPRKEAFTIIMDTPLGRIIQILRPSIGSYHPVQDAMGVSIGEHKLPNGETRPIIGISVADGVSTTQVPKSIKEERQLVPVANVTDEEIVVIGESAEHAAKAARATSRIVWGIPLQEIGYTLTSKQIPDKFGASTAQMLKIIPGQETNALQVMTLGSKKNLSAQGVVIVEKDNLKLNALRFKGENPHISNPQNGSDLLPQDFEYELNSQTPLQIPSDAMIVCSTDGAQLRPDATRILEQIRKIEDPVMLAEFITQREVLRLLLQDVDGKPDKDDGTIVMFIPNDASKHFLSPYEKYIPKEESLSSQIKTRVAVLSTSITTKNAEIAQKRSGLIEQIDAASQQIREITATSGVLDREDYQRILKLGQVGIRLEEEKGKLDTSLNALKNAHTLIEHLTLDKQAENASLIDTCTNLFSTEQEKEVITQAIAEFEKIFNSSESFIPTNGEAILKLVQILDENSYIKLSVDTQNQILTWVRTGKLKKLNQIREQMQNISTEKIQILKDTYTQYTKETIKTADSYKTAQSYIKELEGATRLIDGIQY